MPYGFPKISNRECRDQILAAIAEEIDKRHEFAGVGNCFFGYEFDFKLNITLVTRGERQLEIVKSAKAEQPEDKLCPYVFNDGIVLSWACGLVYGHDGEHAPVVTNGANQPEPPIVSQVKLSGHKQKGKLPKQAREKLANDKLAANREQAVSK